MLNNHYTKQLPKMSKAILFLFIILSLIVCCCGAAYIQNPLARHGTFHNSLFAMPGGAYTHPSISHYVYPSDVISKSEAVSIAKNNVDFYFLYSTTAKLEWIYSLDNPEVPEWVITLKGRLTRTHPGELATKVVRIDGYTGKVICIS